ncbi:MAG: hypothetical protein GY771_12975 [bacterium]|nr:hypothetical protein [bacterium]
MARDEDNYNATKRNLVMAVLAAWVTFLFLLLGGGSFYLFVIKAPNDNYRNKTAIIVRRYGHTLERLNELESGNDHDLKVYRTRLSEILYDFEEAQTEISRVEPPTSPELISFDRNFKTVLKCAIACIEREVT